MLHFNQGSHFVKFFPAAQDVIAAAMYDGRLTLPVVNWQQRPDGEHIRRALKHLTLLQSGDRSAPHLTQATMALLMALELRVLAACNGCYIPRRRCSSCRRAEPLPGQRACRACLTAYQRERLARRAAQRAAQNESNG
jgi:hypothetical protein